MATMAAVSVFTAKAQSNEVATATLKHGDQTFVFTGRDALQKAYVAAADSGDVITLSSGFFQFEGDGDGYPNVCSKSLSIYGAGFENDTITGTTPTQIENTIVLGLKEIKNEDSEGNTVKTTREAKSFYCEGVRLNDLAFSRNIKNVSLVKCYSNDIHMGGVDLVVENLAVRQCHIPYITASTLNGGATNTYKKLYVVNSHIGKIYDCCTTSCTGMIDHSIVTGYLDPAFSWTVTNSIMYKGLTTGDTSRDNIFVGIDFPIEGDDIHYIGNNWVNVDNASLWAEEGEDGSYAADKTFNLKDPAKYMCNDGTQVGLHGGAYSWNKIPSTPRIVESNIDTKTSAAGKLKVNIKVEAQTKE